MVGVISLGISWYIHPNSPHQMGLHHYNIRFGAEVRLPHVLEAHLGTLFGVPWRLLPN